MWSVKESERGSGVVAEQEDWIMARPRAASSWPRVLHPSYYLRRPRRLLVLVLFFVGTTFLLWDRHSLIQRHEVTTYLLLSAFFPYSSSSSSLALEFPC
jgi:cytochrome bd-type quinol oxidase subunit 1